MKKTFNKARMFKYFGYLVIIGLVSIVGSAEIKRKVNLLGDFPGIKQKIVQLYENRNEEEKQEDEKTNKENIKGKLKTSSVNLEIIANDSNGIIVPIKQTSNLEKAVETKYPNPKYTKNNNFKSDTLRMTLARLYYGESSTEVDNKDYLYGVEMSFKNREKIKKKSLKEVILKNNGKTWHYTCFSPKDRNYEKVKDPIGYGSKKQREKEKPFREMIWKKCYDLAGKVLEKDTEPITDKQKLIRTTTHYWVDSVKAPYWTYEHDEDGNYVLDKNKNRIPITPLAIVELKLKNKYGKNYKAYFYDLKSDL